VLRHGGGDAGRADGARGVVIWVIEGGSKEAAKQRRLV
jgi:hypothetical protein